MSRDPHAEQPLLSGVGFLCACPVLMSFNAYFLPWQVLVGAINYIRAICTVVVVSITGIFCPWSLSYSNTGILILF